MMPRSPALHRWSLPANVGSPAAWFLDDVGFFRLHVYLSAQLAGRTSRCHTTGGKAIQEHTRHVFSTHLSYSWKSTYKTPAFILNSRLNSKRILPDRVSIWFGRHDHCEPNRTTTRAPGRRQRPERQGTAEQVKSPVQLAASQPAPVLSAQPA